MKREEVALSRYSCSRSSTLRISWCAALALLAVSLPAQASHQGLVALYDFSGEGDVVRDQSGVGDPLNLRIGDRKAVRREAGSLRITGKTVIRSEKPAIKIINALRDSNELTIEVWCRSEKIDQDGPARVVTLSRDTTNRNFTLGQERDKWDFRLRTNRTRYRRGG